MAHRGARHRAGRRLPAVRAPAGNGHRDPGTGQERRRARGHLRHRPAGVAGGVRLRPAHPAAQRRPRPGRARHAGAGGAADIRLRDRGERRHARDRQRDPARPGHLRRLPARAVRPGQPAPPLPVHQLHGVRPQGDHHRQPALRPDTNVDARLRDVPGLRHRVPRPVEPALPRRADRMRVLRPPPTLAGHDGRDRAAGRLGRHRGRRRRGRQGPGRLPPGLRRHQRRSRVPGTRAQGPRRQALAVMVRDTITAGALAGLSDADRALLTAPSAPIVLAPRRHGVLSPGVCHGMPDIGLFLPYTPLHHLLLDALRRPLVVTSANHADSPMPTIEISGLAVDGVLTHDRPIVARYDDSVIRSFGRDSITIRRGRGLAPALLRLPAAAPPLVAVGAQLKSTFTLADGDRAVLGPHIGDLSDAETLQAYDQALDHLSHLQGIEPLHAAHDLHPGYLSTRLARRWPSRIAVQHHHAHVAAVAAEHRLQPPFLGVAYDGLGLGDDGTFWGGELLLASYGGYRRLGRFSRAPMPGGEAAVRRPARMALGYLLGGELSTGSVPGHLPGQEVIARMIARSVNCPDASSAGRLFDAAAALLGLCEVNGFEGEAATRLEQAAAGFPGAEPLAWRLERHDGLWVYDCVATLRHLLEAEADGEPVGRIAAAFHATIAAVTVLLCERAAAEHDVTQVCLAGGVFQNRLLATDVLARLSAAGFEPYIGERVPVNDAGISYGQAAVAAARLSHG
ncbi:Sua5/YciO/YrdC/YwlC family protein [Nonomuraea rubra]|uniref:Kae1-like domain-containing protein n=1 Tax=Nonomuraea rubra TaxID=46180 RepID=UPI0036240135